MTELDLRGAEGYCTCDGDARVDVTCGVRRHRMVARSQIAATKDTSRWKPPRIVLHPGRCSGQATVGESRIPAELVAGVCWQHGMGEAETQWEPYVDRYGVLVACWYLARYGTRTWRKRWREWLAIADDELWHTTRERWDGCPDPPTVSVVTSK